MTRPRYITTTRSLTYCTTARSCAMNSMVRPSCALQVEQQVQHLRLHGDVERRDRLVGDDELRLEGERAGDADALALAAGEFVRIAVHRVRRQADALPAARATARGRSAAVPMPWMTSASPMMSRTVMRGFEAGIRVLEDHLHAPAQRPQRRRVERGDVGAVEPDAAAGAARAGAGRRGRSWSCRCRIRRPGRASRRGGSTRLTPSTARSATRAAAPNRPPPEREGSRRDRSTSTEAARHARARSSDGSARRGRGIASSRGGGIAARHGPARERAARREAQPGGSATGLGTCAGDRQQPSRRIAAAARHGGMLRSSARV